LLALVQGRLSSSAMLATWGASLSTREAIQRLALFAMALVSFFYQIVDLAQLVEGR
jgi:hypothetical protein